MAIKIINRLKRSIEKNGPELRAFLTGKFPSFLTSNKSALPLKTIPVFVFHTIDPEHFESELKYLKKNGYKSVNADELYTATRNQICNENNVALTFDDATSTFWTYAFPLLKKYGFDAILFAIPGITPEDNFSYPNLDNLWANTCKPADLKNRAATQPLCTWRELEIMHTSGIVDVQSHSNTHARVPISPTIIDFLNPDFDTDIYGNVNIPISSKDDPAAPKRNLDLGAPVFLNAPRMACKLRFIENPEIIKALTDYSDNHGGDDFYRSPKWRRELTNLSKQWPINEYGNYETKEEMLSYVRNELVISRKTLESRLTNKEVRHFCYPWFVGSETADKLAMEAGYLSLHYGIFIGGKQNDSESPLKIQRLSDEYVFLLPGDGRTSLSNIWLNRINLYKRHRLIPNTTS